MIDLTAHIQGSLTEPVAHALWFRQNALTTCDYTSYLVTVTSILITSSTFTNIWGIPTATATITSLIINSTLTSSLVCSNSTTTATSSITTTIYPTTSSTATSTASALNPVVVAAVGLALGLAVGLGVAPAVQNAGAANLPPTAEIDAIVNGMSNSLQLTLPENVVPFRLNGSDVRNDSCGDAGVRTSEGFCLSVLRSGNCPSFSWVTVDPADLSVIPSS